MLILLQDFTMFFDLVGHVLIDRCLLFLRWRFQSDTVFLTGFWRQNRLQEVLQPIHAQTRQFAVAEAEAGTVAPLPCESQALVRHMEMIRQTCSFAVQTQIDKGAPLSQNGYG